MANCGLVIDTRPGPLPSPLSSSPLPSPPRHRPGGADRVGEAHANPQPQLGEIADNRLGQGPLAAKQVRKPVTSNSRLSVHDGSRPTKGLKLRQRRPAAPMPRGRQARRGDGVPLVRPVGQPDAQDTSHRRIPRPAAVSDSPAAPQHRVRNRRRDGGERGGEGRGTIANCKLECKSASPLSPSPLLGPAIARRPKRARRGRLRAGPASRNHRLPPPPVASGESAVVDRLGPRPAPPRRPKTAVPDSWPNGDRPRCRDESPPAVAVRSPTGPPPGGKNLRGYPARPTRAPRGLTKGPAAPPKGPAFPPRSPRRPKTIRSTSPTETPFSGNNSSRASQPLPIVRVPASRRMPSSPAIRCRSSSKPSESSGKCFTAKILPGVARREEPTAWCVRGRPRPPRPSPGA